MSKKFKELLYAEWVEISFETHDLLIERAEAPKEISLDGFQVQFRQKVFGISLFRGWGARLTTPGWKSSWEVFTTHEAADAYLDSQLSLVTEE